MKSAGRTLLAIVAGMGLAMVLLIAVEFLSSIVHPYPPNFDGDIPAHVRRYPQWFLGVAVLAWGATAAAAGWVASRIDPRWAGIVVALLLAGGLIFNLSKLPYPMWFKIAMLIAFPVASFLGIRYGSLRARSTVAGGAQSAAP